VMLRTFLA